MHSTERMKAIASIDLASLATVTGGALPAAAPVAVDQLSAHCERALNGLITRRHAVPLAFTVACGELLPQLKAGRRVVRDHNGVARPASES